MTNIINNHISILSIIFACLCLFGCQEKDSGLSYTINGRINGIPDDTKIYLFDIDQAKNIDSALTSGYTFKMKGRVENPINCNLVVDESMERAELIVENTKIEFDSPFKNMYTESKVRGGYEQTLKNELNDLTQPFQIKYNSISDTLLNNKYRDEQHRKELIMRHRKLINQEKKVMYKFILDNPNSFLTLNLLYRNRKEISIDSLSVAFHKIEINYQQASDAARLKKYIAGKESELKSGDHYIDFTTNNLSDDKFQLSSLEGNFIYLTFWNSGCLPCRKENQHFSEIYDTLPEDLEIVSFYVHNKKGNWQKASKADEIKWTNVSDLKGTKGEIAMAYSVQAIPASFLIGKDGIIIEKFTGYDDESYDELINLIDVHRMNN